MKKQIISSVLILVVLQASIAGAGEYPSLRKRSDVSQEVKPPEQPAAEATSTVSEVTPAPPQPTSPGDTAPYYEKQYEGRPDSFKPLNKGVGWGLALSPLGGDGLIYTGHPVWGATLLGGQLLIGVPLLVTGLTASDKGFLAGAINDIFVGFGATAIIGTFVLDAVITPLLVHKHNKNLKSPAKRVEPYVSYDGQTMQGGMRMQF